MNLRARLILAFLALSVLPLTAVTIHSYRSSTEAMRRTAESEARTLAREMTARMDTVTKDIGQRIERIWMLPPPPPGPAKPPATDSQRAAESVSAVLGQAAGLVDRLEFVAPETGLLARHHQGRTGRGSECRADRSRPAAPTPPS